MELGFAQVDSVGFRRWEFVRNVRAHVLGFVPDFKIVDAVLCSPDLERTATIVVLGKVKTAGITGANHLDGSVLGSLVFVNEVAVLTVLSELVCFATQLGAYFAWGSCAVYASGCRVVATIVIVFGIAVLFGEPARDKNLRRYVIVKGDDFVFVDKVAGDGWHVPACFIE